MTDNNHPITPPPELVREWAKNRGYSCADELWDYIATQAARWGADMELDAVIDAILSHPGFEQPELFVELLRGARRPRSLSLKKSAMDVLDELSAHLGGVHYNILLRALESLPE